MAETSTRVAKQNLSADNRMAQGRTVPRFAFLALLGGNAALATGPLFVRLADVGPVSAAFWRLALALPFLLIFSWRQGGGTTDWRTVRSLAPLVLLGGIFFAADLASWHLGIMQTKMAHATLFGNAASLILAVTTFVVARRLPFVSEGGAVLLAVAGAILLMRESGQEGEAQLTGDLLCILAGILYAGYVIALQRARHHLASWPTLALATAAGVGPLLLAAWLMGEAIVPGNWAPVIALSLASQIVGQGLLIYALPFFSELVVGLTLLTQPAMAALIGWIVYRESLSPWELLGGAMVAVALVLVRLPKKISPNSPSS